MQRWIVRSVVTLVVLLLLLALAIWLLLRGSLPELDGEAVLGGLAAPVTIERDALGTPTIRAESRVDAMRALGFVHGQERYFEIDLMRRSAAGELSELFGAVALEADQRIRVHRLRARAERVVAEASPAHRALLDAYVEGVNAGLADLAVRPWPYLVLRDAPRPWRAEDSVLVSLAMFIDLHDEYNRRELGLAQIERHLDPRVAALLRRDGTAWDAPLQGDARGAVMLPDFGDGATVVPTTGTGAPAEPTPGSNNFAVAGTLTDDGRALVANDMHLGLRVPSLWLRVRLVHPDDGRDGAPLSVTGVSLPGVPGVVAGSNGHVAWGFTNSYGDWLDWFAVDWVDAEHRRYRTPEGEEAVTEYEERILVRDDDPVLLRVRETRWGPVLHEDVHGRGLALAWTAHRPGGLDQTLLDLAGAHDLAEALAIGAGAGMPSQNLVAGDRTGAIGWAVTGRIPHRVGDCDPQLPLEPLRGCAWDGWVPPERAPRLVDPSSGRLWTANARVADGEDLALVGDGGYDLGARQQQIRDGLLARERFDEADLLALQLDDRALLLERWWRLLSEVLDADTHDDKALRALTEATSEWDGHASIDSVSYRLVRAFRFEVHDALYDRLLAPARAAEGEDFVPPRLPQFEGVAWALLEARPPSLPGSGAVDWNALLHDAARAVVDELGGPGELAGRSWGERNRAAVRHPLSGALPGWLARHLDMPADPLPGDANMPRVQAPGFGASERFVVAPGREEEGLMHLPGGPSGHPLSPFHAAGHRDWVLGTATPFLPGPPVHRLRLGPGASGS